MTLLWVAYLVLLGCVERCAAGHALLLAAVLWLLRLLPG